jgi:hypothetical protein
MKLGTYLFGFCKRLAACVEAQGGHFELSNNQLVKCLIYLLTCKALATFSTCLKSWNPFNNHQVKIVHRLVAAPFCKIMNKWSKTLQICEQKCMDKHNVWCKHICVVPGYHDFSVIVIVFFSYVAASFSPFMPVDFREISRFNGLLVSCSQ